MEFKTVLAVTGSDLGDSDLRMAVTLCQEVDAHLAVLVMALAAPPPIGGYAAVMSEAWLEERQADMDKLQQRTAEVSAFLAVNAVSSDISSEYQEETWADETIGQRARYTDIVLLGQKRVMIAWDSRLEASNAVTSAMDLLSAADAVHVVLVDPIGDEGGQGAEPGADIATYLARHGVKVTVDRLPSQGRTVAETLRQHAIDASADLLAMGAYGHSRLRQRIFGGVTRSMVDEPPLAVLMTR